MRRSRDAARAGLLLAAGLWLWAWPRAGPPASDCAQPVLRAPAEIVCGTDASPPARLVGPARRLFGLPIDPNRADALTLETLPGIGPERARAILRERSRRRFVDLEDLERVRGLGPARVSALAPFVAFDERLAAREATSVRSPGCRSCCGSSCGARPAAPPAREEDP